MFKILDFCNTINIELIDWQTALFIEILYYAPREAYLFQKHLGRGGGGGLFERRSLFNLAQMMVSVLHKELEYKVEKPRIVNKCELPVGERTILDWSTRSFTVVID